jgi:hypothetical protein
MSDFTWIVLFAAGGYLLAIFLGILKSAIDVSLRKTRRKKQLKVCGPALKHKTIGENDKRLSIEDSEGDGLILFDDVLFPPELPEDYEDK